MKKPTLDEFIAAYGTRKYPSNLYVKERGFKEMYVRMTKRWHGDHWRDPTLDLANIMASRPGNGAFTGLVQRLRRDHPGMPLFVESVLNLRFRSKLLALGFKPVAGYRDCFVLFPEDKT